MQAEFGRQMLLGQYVPTCLLPLGLGFGWCGCCPAHRLLQVGLAWRHFTILGIAFRPADWVGVLVRLCVFVNSLEKVS